MSNTPPAGVPPHRTHQEVLEDGCTHCGASGDELREPCANAICPRCGNPFGICDCPPCRYCNTAPIEHLSSLAVCPGTPPDAGENALQYEAPAGVPPEQPTTYPVSGQVSPSVPTLEESIRELEKFVATYSSTTHWQFYARRVAVLLSALSASEERAGEWMARYTAMSEQCCQAEGRVRELERERTAVVLEFRCDPTFDLGLEARSRMHHYDMALAELKDLRAALTVAGGICDELNGVDLHDAAYEISQTRGIEEPDDDCYAAAFVRAALRPSGPTPTEESE